MKATRFENTKTANLLSLMTALAAGISVLTTTGCKKKTPPSPPPSIVQVETVQTSKMPLNLEFIGQLVSPETVEVRARVEAFVEKMLFIEGSEVQKGAPLFLLDKKPRSVIFYVYHAIWPQIHVLA